MPPRRAAAAAARSAAVHNAVINSERNQLHHGNPHLHPVPHSRNSLDGMANLGTLAAAPPTISSKSSILTGRSSVAQMFTPHTLFPWFEVPIGQEYSELSPQEVTDTHGVQESVIVSFLEQEVKNEQAVMSLPWAMLSVFLFAFMSLNHETLSDKHTVVASLRFDLQDNANFAFTEYNGAKNYEDVNSYSDFWSWLTLGYMPLMNLHDVPVSEGSTLDLGANSWNQSQVYLNRYRRVGPIKLSQELAEDVECKNKDVANTFGMSCTKRVNVNMDIEPTVMDQTQSVYDEATDRTVWLNGWLLPSRMKVLELESQGWLNPKTNRVMVSNLMYHPDSETIIMTDVSFLFSRTGRIWKIITPMPVNINPYDGWTVYLADILLYLQVTVLLITEVKEVALSIRHSGLSKGMKEYMNIWNLIDWIFVLGAYCLLVLWIIRVVRAMEVKDMLLDLPDNASVCMDDCPSYYATLFDKVSDLGAFDHACRSVVAVFPMFIMCRLFKAFAAQPRLALVTVSLGKAMPDLLHFLIVFGAIFGTYTVMSVALFGRKVASFATLDRAIPSLFLMFQGEFEWTELEKVGRIYSFTVFVSFMWLVSMVMLSMLISIIMDCYVEVKERSVRLDSIWTEVYTLARRSWQSYRKQRQRIPKILGYLDKTSEELLKVEDLTSRVPGLGGQQAHRLLCDCLHDFIANNSTTPSGAEVGLHVEKVSLGLQGIPEYFKKISAQQAQQWKDRLPPLPAVPRPIKVPSRAAGKGAPVPELLAHKLELDRILDIAEARVSDGKLALNFPDAQETLLDMIFQARALGRSALFNVQV